MCGTEIMTSSKLHVQSTTRETERVEVVLLILANGFLIIIPGFISNFHFQTVIMTMMGDAARTNSPAAGGIVFMVL
jgi:UPF0716 family protein affecting phage T7 exclusion